MENGPLPVELLTFSRRSLLLAAAAAGVVSPTAARAAAPAVDPTGIHEPREAILEPDLPIIDPHHHLWDRTGPTAAPYPAAPGDLFANLIAGIHRYSLPELVRDVSSGHNIVATVSIQCKVMYRRDGAESLRPVGEVEYINGMAAMSASGNYGRARLCDGIVGFVNLELGDGVVEVLQAHKAAAGSRFKGVRQNGTTDPDWNVLGNLGVGVPEDLYDRPNFVRGVSRLRDLGLHYETWVVEPQLPTIVRLAKAVPDVKIVLNHLGTPLGIGRFRNRREERFPIWQRQMRELAQCRNVVVKLGGLGMPCCGFTSYLATPRARSEQLAAQWRPYIETCIEAFGVDRCMFESNYPSDAGTADYPTIWNAFKRVASGASPDEKAALFSRTAASTYHLAV